LNTIAHYFLKIMSLKFPVFLPLYTRVFRVDTATMLELFPSRTAFLLHDLPALKLRNLQSIFYLGIIGNVVAT